MAAVSGWREAACGRRGGTGLRNARGKIPRRSSGILQAPWAGAVDCDTSHQKGVLTFAHVVELQIFFSYLSSALQ